ncbi:MAG: UDP-N-acetylglucosamine 1-carboxyvinyltransferase [Oscillospiraceae bacterium]
MQKLVVSGGNRLGGEIVLQGAKNSVLPLLAASVLCCGRITFLGCPRISDRYAAMRILNHLGCCAEGKDGTVTVNAETITSADIPDELMRETRCSVIFMGALLGRCEQCRLSLPGGCNLGPRPIDYHISALTAMGAEISEKHGEIICSAPDGLHGARIALTFPSVGATENILLAAVLAEGETVITNAAREPEIIDLANFLISCGADIRGAGSGTMIISGVKKLRSDIEYRVMPDRIACATYLSYTAACGGEILIKDCEPSHMDAILSVLEQMGCSVKIFGKNIYLSRTGTLKSVGTIRTMVYPGFPTDAQAVIMIPLCLAEGTTLFVENIFENRYRHTGELQRMGADIRAEGKVAVVSGVKRLYGAKTEAPDLRGGAALVGAALCAEGVSEISRAEYIDRGYEDIEGVIRSLGGRISRVYS